MSLAKLKPFRDYSEHDVVNGIFSLDTQTGALGTLVKIAGSGFINGNNELFTNINSTIPNVYTPRKSTVAKVTRTTSGDRPFGFLLYDVKEVNFQGVSFAYDPARKAEAQCVISGEAVPVVRKGLFLVAVPTGQLPAPGKVLVADNTTAGEWACASAGTAKSFGVCLGSPDADGYTLVAVDFNKAA